MPSNTKSTKVAENFDDDLSDGTHESRDGAEEALGGLDDALGLAKEAKKNDKVNSKEITATQVKQDGPTKPCGEKLSSATESDGDDGILLVLKAFKMLQSEFNAKFRVMWA